MKTVRTMYEEQVDNLLIYNDLVDDSIEIPDAKQLLRMIYQFDFSLAQLAKYKNKDDGYGYIPAPHMVFLNKFMRIVSQIGHKNFKFLEVGCAVGTKLYLVQNIAGIKNVDGIELRKEYADIAKNMIKGEIFNVDARDFTEYHNYDVIYTYCPINNVDKEIKLIDQIKENMKKGAILFQYMFGESIGDLELWTKE